MTKVREAAMLSGRRLSVVLALSALLASSGCGSTSHRSSHVPSPESTRLLPRSQVPCERAAGQESLDGPLEWEHYGTQIIGRPWGASRRGVDMGLLSLMTTQSIVLDSVTIDPQDPQYFSPVRLLGAWVSRHAANYLDQLAGRWPDRLYKLSCYKVSAQPEVLDVGAAPVLVVRLIASPQATDRAWSANRGVVVHYHTLDGHEYAAPMGFVNVFPNGPGVDPELASPYLAKPVEDGGGACGPCWGTTPRDAPPRCC